MVRVTMVNINRDPFLLAHVQYVSDDGLTVLFALQNGSVIPAQAESEDSFAVNDVVIIDKDGNVESVEPSVWPRKLKEDDDDSVDISSFRVSAADLGLTFEDFGGSTNLIQRARDLIELPLTHRKELTEIGARGFKGVLLHGPPGTGKTHLARIVACQAGATFYLINGPEIFSKYVGDSEALLRGIFEDAKKNQPAIVFFDEIDSIAPERTADSHDSSRRAVAQLLTLMDGFNHDLNVMVIAATNRRDDIDKALLRPGRFDVHLEFPSPTHEDRLQILRASGKNIRKAENLPWGTICHLTDGWSAAEMASIWTEAAMLAVKSESKLVRSENLLEAVEALQASRPH